jgi:hypothetical protein
MVKCLSPEPSIPRHDALHHTHKGAGAANEAINGP